MASIVINSITLDCTPGEQFNTSIAYALAGSGFFTSAGTALTNTNGTFVSPFVINDLDEDTCYDIRFTNATVPICIYIEEFCIGAGTTTTTTTTTSTSTTTTSTTTTTTQAPPQFNWLFTEISGGNGLLTIDVNSVNVVFEPSDDSGSFSAVAGDLIEITVSGVGSHTKALVVESDIDGTLHSSDGTDPRFFSFNCQAGRVYQITATVEIV